MRPKMDCFAMVLPFACGPEGPENSRSRGCGRGLFRSPCALLRPATHHEDDHASHDEDRDEDEPERGRSTASDGIAQTVRGADRGAGPVAGPQLRFDLVALDLGELIVAHRS